MASIYKKTVDVPDTGLPEVQLIAVSNGWVAYAGRYKTGESMSWDRVIAAFENFDSMTAWLKENIEDNTVDHSDALS